jgi:hypothetical protein
MSSRGGTDEDELAVGCRLDSDCGFAGYAEDKKTYDECVAKVRKGLSGAALQRDALNQMIARECGNPPQPPTK